MTKPGDGRPGMEKQAFLEKKTVWIDSAAHDH